MANTTTLQFNTNINCGSCVRAVTAFIADVPGLQHWEVDTEVPNKLLTVEVTAGTSAADVVAAVEAAGFSAEAVPQA